MTELEEYIYHLLLEDCGEVSVDKLTKAALRIARYIRSSREGYTWKGTLP